MMKVVGFLALGIMFRWLTFRKKSLAEKTLEAMEKRQANMSPSELSAAEDTFQRITQEVRDSRSSADETRVTGTPVPPGVRPS